MPLLLPAESFNPYCVLRTRPSLTKCKVKAFTNMTANHVTNHTSAKLHATLPLVTKNI